MIKLRNSLIKLMGGKNYKPMNSAELAMSLGIPSSERRQLRLLLSKLEREGRVKIGNKRSYRLCQNEQIVLVGTLRFQPNGNGWFYPKPNNAANLNTAIDLKIHDRIFVAWRDMNVALDGDYVSLKVTRFGSPKWKKRRKKSFDNNYSQSNNSKNKKDAWKVDLKQEVSGRVLKILERKNNIVIGMYCEEGQYCFVQPESNALPSTIDILGNCDALPGQIVAAEIIKWHSRNVSPVGKIIKVIGFSDAAGVDIACVIQKHNLRVDFDPEVLQEAEKMPTQITKHELARREDWRDALVVTIDPADAKDHDDAVLVEKTSRGWKLAVHVADVSYYVKPGSALDVEAQLRGNSTYLVDRVLPMLPEQISNNICSLKPNVDRLTKCAVMEFDRDGKLLKNYFCDAVMNSKSKLSYEEAQIFIEGNQGGAIGDAIRTAWELADTLRKKRFADGALNLDFPEVQVILDKHTKQPIKVEKIEYNESHQMIEEFMLATNQAVAIELKMKRKNTLFRIHEDPDADRLFEFAEIARIHGFQVGDLTNKKHIQKLLEEAKKTPLEQSIKLGFLKSLKRAAYSVEAIGHYGLAKMDYCHFTSPIRRYADLIVHRSIQEYLINPPSELTKVPKLQKLEQIAQHISETERTSAEAESTTKRMKIFQHLFILSQNNSQVTFTGLITDVRRMGLFVEITDMQVKGLIKKETFPKGKWVFDSGTLAFRNYKNSQSFRLGENVTVQILKVDLESQLVDFILKE